MIYATTELCCSLWYLLRKADSAWQLGKSNGAGAAEPPEAATPVTLEATLAVLRQTSTSGPWLAKNLVWLLPSSHCSSMEVVAVRLHGLCMAVMHARSA